MATEEANEVSGNEEEVRAQLINESGEPILEDDGSPVILDADVTRALMQAAEADGVSVEEKLAEVLAFAVKQAEINEEA